MIHSPRLWAIQFLGYRAGELRNDYMIALLNLGRALMLVWIAYALLLVFAPGLVHRPADPIGGAIQALVAFGLGYLIDLRGKPRPSGRGRIARTPQASFGLLRCLLLLDVVANNGNRRAAATCRKIAW